MTAVLAAAIMCCAGEYGRVAIGLGLGNSGVAHPGVQAAQRTSTAAAAAAAAATPE